MLYEDPVAALVAGLSCIPSLNPSHVATAQTLVANFQWIHGGFTVSALGQLSRVPCSPVGAVAVPALVEN